MYMNAKSQTDLKLHTQLIVQLETLAGQIVRARLLSPWRSQAVGRSWQDVEPKLKKLAERELSRAAPRKWLASIPLTDPPERERLEIPLAPKSRTRAWPTELPIPVDVFRWQLRDGMTLIKMPAIGSELFGPTETLTAAVIQQQARVTLQRLAETFDLWDVRRKFFDREFSYLPLNVSPPNRGPASTDPSTRRAAQQRTETLRSAASDLTRAELEPVYGRDVETREVAEYLIGQAPQSVLLVGAAGVGKTAIVHRLVQLSAELGLGARKIWSTTGSRLVSGMSGMGMWQERCIQLIREAHATQAILHVGALMELMEAGKIDGQPGVASMIRQAIGRGRLVVIGECTPQQIALLERDEPLLLRALVRYNVEEPEADTLTAILRQAADDRVRAQARRPDRQCQFTDAAIDELHRLHRRYATYSALPAQPLRLMQTLLDQAPPGGAIDGADVARAFASQSGLPRFLIDDSEPIDLVGIRHQLSAHVIGQDEPVELVVNLIATLKARMVRPGRPLASLMFIGPTGVGKTEMAKALAELLYSDPRRMVRIDMSEYASPWSAVRLIGRPDEGDGTLTSPIREQPFSVVLLDEFEKADPAVFDMLLQLLGEGRLTDALGRLADFRNAVVIMTSNLGVESFRESNFGFNDARDDSWRAHFEREVQRFVRPELLGRIDRIVPFQPLPRDVVRQIALRELQRVKGRPGLKYANIQLDFDPALVEHVCTAGYQPKYGARPLRRAIEQLVTVPLANTLSELDTSHAWKLWVDLRDGQVHVEATQDDRQVKSERQSAEEAIDDWQQLGRLARMALESSPLRDLENETARTVRLNDTYFEKLKTVKSPRLTTQIKTEIQRNSVVIERNNRLREELHATCRRILSAHAGVLLDWHRNHPLDAERLHTLPQQLLNDLKVVVSALVEGHKTTAEKAQVWIIGKPPAHVAVLWEAYERIAREQKWDVAYYLAKPYDATRHRLHLEQRARAAQRASDDAPVPTSDEPTFRLASSEPAADKPEYAADVYRVEHASEWLSEGQSAAALVMTLNGVGVQAWLGDEVGVMHFLESPGSSQSNRRRIRIKVDIQPGKLEEATLPNNWQEPTGPASRDPRRLFSVSEDVITDAFHPNHFIRCAVPKWPEQLVDMIRQQRERQLWAAIGFQGMEPTAMLQYDAAEDRDLPY
jgi:ATP-dependent Clp protease ATP-binding subunit ClpA